MTNFYGYETETQMREHNPRFADWLIANSEKTPTRISTRGKKCMGSIDGKTFIYADGSTDEGQTVTSHKAKVGSVAFKWISTQ